MSFSWDAVFQGSLVTSTSPGRSVSTGKRSRKWIMPVAIELMWPGVPVTAWATMRPRRSKTPAERSPDSRTIDVKDDRMSAAACSLTVATSRFQRMSRVI